jgi:hypothetical protein
MTSQRTWNAHPHLAWAMWGLDEIEATLASIESGLRSRASVHPKAESVMVDMRTARDAFRKSIAEHDARVNDAALARSKADLEGQWAAFEDSVQNYLDAVDKQVSEQETVFRARADAQSKAWLQAIDNLLCARRERTWLATRVPLWKTSIVRSVKRASTVSRNRANAPGRGGLLQLLGMSLSPCCRFHPAEMNSRVGQCSAAHTAFALQLRARPSDLLIFEATTRSLLLRPGDS